jgi:hypothetical protein
MKRPAATRERRRWRRGGGPPGLVVFARSRPSLTGCCTKGLQCVQAAMRHAACATGHAPSALYECSSSMRRPAHTDAACDCPYTPFVLAFLFAPGLPRSPWDPTARSRASSTETATPCGSSGAQPAPTRAPLRPNCSQPLPQHARSQLASSQAPHTKRKALQSGQCALQGT